MVHLCMFESIIVLVKNDDVVGRAFKVSHINLIFFGLLTNLSTDIKPTVFSAYCSASIHGIFSSSLHGMQ